VFGLAADHSIKVMLDGQGADELLAGYQQILYLVLAGALRSDKKPSPWSWRRQRTRA